MRRLYRLFSSLFSHLPAARWCLGVAVVSFAAVVSVYKYIDMADMAVFSSLETMYLILTDTMNTVFIYLPLYLFIVSGIMFDNGYGEIGILRFKSRTEWLSVKAAAYVLNTVVFFGIILLINYVVSSQVFSFSDVWSGDFIGFRVVSGQPASDFEQPPVPTIISACASVFMLYILCGFVNMLVSLVSGRESVGLFVSLALGIAFGVADMVIIPDGFMARLNCCAALLLASAAICAVSGRAVKKKNFAGKKMY